METNSAKYAQFQKYECFKFAWNRVCFLLEGLNKKCRIILLPKISNHQNMRWDNWIFNLVEKMKKLRSLACSQNPFLCFWMCFMSNVTETRYLLREQYGEWKLILFYFFGWKSLRSTLLYHTFIWMPKSYKILMNIEVKYVKVNVL